MSIEINIISKVKEIYKLNIDTKQVEAKLKKLSKMSFSLDARKIITDAGLAFSEGKETFSLKGVIYPKDGYTDPLNLQALAGSCVDGKFAKAIVPPTVNGSKLGELDFSVVWDVQEQWHAAKEVRRIEQNPAIWGHAYVTSPDDFLNAATDDYLPMVTSREGAELLHYTHVVLSGVERKLFALQNTEENGWVYSACDKTACLGIVRPHTHAVHSNCLTIIRVGEVVIPITPPLDAYRGNMVAPVMGAHVDVNAVHSFMLKSNRRDATSAVASIVPDHSYAGSVVSEAPEGGAPLDDDNVDEERLRFVTAKDAFTAIRAVNKFEHLRSVMQNANNGWRSALNNMPTSETAKNKKRKTLKTRFVNHIYKGEPKTLGDIMSSIDHQISGSSAKEAEAHIAYYLMQLTLGGQSRLACVDGLVVLATLE